MSEVWRALADPTRREILQMLRSKDMTAGEIAERFPIAKSTLSGHFAVLRQAGLVVSERQGSTIRYSLNLAAWEEALGGVLELFGVGARNAAPGPHAASRRWAATVRKKGGRR